MVITMMVTSWWSAQVSGPVERLNTFKMTFFFPFVNTMDGKGDKGQHPFLLPFLLSLCFLLSSSMEVGA